ncbi:MAG: CinA family nicotinamide mononucleotide deamidase-related protein [Flavobacteriaceae bacterium]|nr:CinA family nicotinamide mononucleotide deamidase-related protein [Flavobacteriaceae bacterium]
MKKMITAHVISIGDEILFGQTLDTNSHFLAVEFAKISIELIQISAVQDKKKRIRNEILSSPADIIITTGGLGPTRDDKTKYVLSQITGKALELNDQALKWTQDYFENTVKRPMNKLNRNQALVPIGTIPLHNKMGTAPGLWTEFGKKILICLPGVPHEMKFLMKNEILPRLIERFDPIFIFHEFVQTYNIAESELAEILTQFEKNLPDHLSLAYLPHGKRIRLRITGHGDDSQRLKNEIQEQIEILISLIPAMNFLSRGTLSLTELTATALKEKNLEIATAESFTAGKIAEELTTESGSSVYFKAGIVAYSPEMKEKLLQVPQSLIQEKGVASAEVALAMAHGARNICHSDIGISSTGVAGPNPDSFGTPPGVAFIAIVSDEKEKVYSFHFPELERIPFTKKCTDLAIQKLYDFLR